jgi:hypothetical protein
VKQLSDYIIPALVEALHKEPETEMCSSMLDSLNECMQDLLQTKQPEKMHIPTTSSVLAINNFLDVSLMKTKYELFRMRLRMSS